jgi:hypothetical protein
LEEQLILLKKTAMTTSFKKQIAGILFILSGLALLSLLALA